ncbi:MAG: LemA family protein [Pseudomonadota bacterium]|nr:LemA family protein [Pseudomonadota bacterium]
MIAPVRIALIVIALAVILMFNGLVRRRNRAEKGWRQIDVQLKRRHDLIPQLVECVRDSMAYEQETLKKVIDARAKALGADGRAEIIAAEVTLGAAVGRFLGVMEAYPDLKAQDNIARLMEMLTTAENRIAFSRQYYNDAVINLNTRIDTFPSNLIARVFSFTKRDYFKASDEERQVVTVDFEK